MKLKSFHLAARRYLPAMIALAMTGSVYAQLAAHKPVQNRMPGERLTSAQRRILGGFGPDVTVEFDNRDVPALLMGRLASRVHPDDAAAEAQSALDALAGAFRRGPQDGFRFASVESDKAGNQLVHTSQVYKGVPVVDGELTVQLDRYSVIGISGHFVADLSLDSQPAAASPAVAISRALAFAAQEGYANAQVLGLREPVVIADAEGVGSFATPVEIAYDDAQGNGHDQIFVSAAGDRILGHRALAPAIVPTGCSPTQICPSTQLLLNPGFDSGHTGDWNDYSTYGGRNSVIYQGCGFNSAWCAYIGAWGASSKDTVYQEVAIPANASTATLSYYLKIWTSQAVSAPMTDTLQVQIRAAKPAMIGYTLGPVLYNVASYSNVSAQSWPFGGGNYIRQSFDVSAYRGQTIVVYFEGNQKTATNTGFEVDSVLLTVQ